MDFDTNNWKALARAEEARAMREDYDDDGDARRDGRRDDTGYIASLESDVAQLKARNASLLVHLCDCLRAIQDQNNKLHALTERLSEPNVAGALSESTAASPGTGEVPVPGVSTGAVSNV